MNLVQTRTYPVSAEQLLSLLTSQAFYIGRYNILDVDDYSFEQCEQTEQGFVVHIKRNMPIKTDRIPGFARRFVGETAELSTQFVWDNEGPSPYVGRYSVTMAGAPVTIEGKVRISAQTDDSCEQYIALTIDCSVPLIGKKLAALLAERVEKVLEDDYKATLEYIQKHV